MASKRQGAGWDGSRGDPAWSTPMAALFVGLIDKMEATMDAVILHRQRQRWWVGCISLFWTSKICMGQAGSGRLNILALLWGVGLIAFLHPSRRRHVWKR